MSATSGLPSAPAARADLAIVVCTFHREALLTKALASLAAQTQPPGLRIEIIVVDNSDAGSARTVVETAAAASRFDMRWIEAHPPNISVARNAGLAASDAPAIAFLDDDQVTAPDWLEVVAIALKDMPYDGIFGAVEPQFEAPARATAMARRLFSRRLDAPRGEELFALGAAKTRGIALATNNSIFRRAAIPANEPAFDIAFGNGGGEDYDLICRMQRDGRRFGWLPEARAYEFVPAARCEAAYLRRRFFAGGQAYAAAVAKASPHPRVARWIIRAKAAVQIALLTLKTPVAVLRGREALVDHLHVLSGSLGKLAIGEIRPIYRQNIPPRAA